VKPVTPETPKKILLIRLKGIGDVILSTPVFRALRKKFPSAEIHLLTRSFCEPVVRHDPSLNKVIVHPDKNATFGETIRFVLDLRRQRYDWVLDLAAEPRSAWLTLATGAPLRAGYAFHIREWAFNHRIPKNTVRKYQGEVNLDIIRALGVPDAGNQTEIHLGGEEKKWAEEFFSRPEIKGLKHRIGVNPTGTWSSKRWPASHWRELVEKIHQTLGVKPILLGGPGDEGLIQEIRTRLEDKTLVKPETTLLQAAMFVSHLDLLIGNDGTPQHFAQAFGTRSLTLCGPHWGMSWTKPGDQRHRYLQHFLDCGPCDLNVCPFPKEQGSAAHVHQECLVKITPEKVLDVTREMLKA
jgi:ADP-heptose:LPS heptosyltransferase